jgi:hypothetical protein
LELRGNESGFTSLIKISFPGLVAVTSLLFYQSILSIGPVDTRNIQLLNETAYIVLALLLTGVCLSLVGATRYFMRSSPKNIATRSPTTVVLLSLALNDKRSLQSFILASMLYGLFFAFVSGFLVYQPLGSFTQRYGVSVPSMLPVICCGPLGQVPQFVVYLTQQFAILIVPVNLILLLAVSWLVGLNVAVGTFSYKNRSNNARSHWFGGLGAIVGLFTACPTCAGFFFLTMLGLAGAVTFSLVQSSLQIVSTGIGLSMLSITPIMTARRIPKDWATFCSSLGDREAR